MRMALVVIVALVALAGCKRDREVDMEKICNAEKLSGADKAPEGTRAQHMAVWLDKELKTQYAMEVFKELASIEPQIRAGWLKTKAANAGYDGPCPIADEL
jgi:hypothetical protein